MFYLAVPNGQMATASDEEPPLSDKAQPKNSRLALLAQDRLLNTSKEAFFLGLAAAGIGLAWFFGVRKTRRYGKDLSGIIAAAMLAYVLTLADNLNGKL